MMCKVFPTFLLDIVVCDAQKHKYCIYTLFSRSFYKPLSISPNQPEICRVPYFKLT